ncbi:DMT family transporter [Commensalibacter nepenthis]|uniref:EamA family transporter n=1 Tax=Commensalibacter nepenthis TaxID=3043872 RepID=A0ABT6QAT7_9PROT|nr:EamA family transporter [Commensalibacter sp. TBRC 10068]MDI2113430.1 EamA family transporter [Commensalibacter sp. TBRC 10068]
MPLSSIKQNLASIKTINLTSERAGMIYIITAGCIWGLGGVVGQYVLQYKHIDAAWIIGIRLWLPGILLLSLCYRKHKSAIFKPLKNPQELMLLIVFSVVGMMASQLFYFLTIKYSNAATATILQYLYPVVIAIILAIYLRKRPSIYVIISIILAITGAFCLVTDGSIDKITLPAKAIVYGSICVIGSVTYTLLPIPLLKKYNTTTIAGWGMFIGGVILNFFHPFWHFSGIADFPAVLSIIFIIFATGMLAFLLYLIGVKIVGSSKGSILATIEPLAAAFSSVIFLNVKFSWVDWFGAACIIAMIIILAKNKV